MTKLESELTKWFDIKPGYYGKLAGTVIENFIKNSMDGVFIPAAKKTS